MPRRTLILLVLTILVLNIAVFWFIFPSFWLADDFYYIWISRFSSLTELIAKQALLCTTDFFRPFFYLAFGLDWALFKLNTSLYYIANFILHSLNAILVFFLVNKITRDQRIGFLSSVIFCVFPGHFEAIGWLNPINHLMMTAFYVSSVMWFVDFKEKAKTSSIYLSALFWALALSSHEGAITLPIVLLAYDIIKEKRNYALKALVKYWPYALIFVLYVCLNIFKNVNMVRTSAIPYSIGPHFFPNWLDYLATLIIPAITSYKLSALLPQAILSAINFSKLALMWLIPPALVLLLIKTKDRTKFFLLWPIIITVPFSFFVTPHVSRYLYLASIGFAALIASLAVYIYDRAASNLKKAAIISCTGILIIVYLVGMVGLQKVYAGKKETRRGILNDLKTIIPKTKPGSTLYFIGLPIRDDEIIYMTYLWFGEERKIVPISEASAKTLKMSGDPILFTYKNGNLKRL